MSGMNVDDLALTFDMAAHEKHLTEANDPAIAFIGIAPDDEVGNACFIFECDEDDA